MWSRLNSKIDIKISAAILIVFASLFYVFLPSIKHPLLQDDYAIYTFFSEAASQGHNPYNVPSSFRSETIKLFPTVTGHGNEGMVVQSYADNLPLLTWIYKTAYMLSPLKGIFILTAFLYFCTIILYLLIAIFDKELRSNTVIFLIFISLNPLVAACSILPAEDKSIFLFFMVLSLAYRKNFLGTTLILALFACLKGLGIIIFPFYILYGLTQKKITLKHAFVLGTVFALIFGASHMLWFPECLHSYAWRGLRHHSVAHASFFIIPKMLGVTHLDIFAKILMLGSFFLLGISILKKKLSLQDVLILPVILSIVFNTEPSLDRLVVAIFGLALGLDSLGIVILYIIGFLIVKTNFNGMLYSNNLLLVLIPWTVTWGTIASLLVWKVKSIIRAPIQK